MEQQGAGEPGGKVSGLWAGLLGLLLLGMLGGVGVSCSPPRAGAATVEEDRAPVLLLASPGRRQLTDILFLRHVGLLDRRVQLLAVYDRAEAARREKLIRKYTARPRRGSPSRC